MKDLTKELYFSPGASTTIAEVKRLFETLLATTWTINIYRSGVAQTKNLKDLGWTIGYNNAKTSAGICRRKRRRNMLGGIDYYGKRVELSMHLLTQNLDQANQWEETIRHELAHAVDMEMRGTSNHDRVWQAVAGEMLSTGERTFSSDDLKDEKLSRYTLKCIEDDCDFTRPSHKARPLNARSHPCCNDCYNKGKGKKRLVQIQNY